MPAFHVGDLVILQYPDQPEHFHDDGANAVVTGVVDGGTDYWVCTLGEHPRHYLCAPHQLRRPDFPSEDEEEDLCAELIETV